MLYRNELGGGGSEINVFEAGREVLRVGRRIVSHIMDKRKKANWANYQSRNDGKLFQLSTKPDTVFLNSIFCLQDTRSFVCIKTTIHESTVRIDF